MVNGDVLAVLDGGRYVMYATLIVETWVDVALDIFRWCIVYFEKETRSGIRIECVQSG